MTARPHIQQFSAHWRTGELAPSSSPTTSTPESPVNLPTALRWILRRPRRARQLERAPYGGSVYRSDTRPVQSTQVIGELGGSVLRDYCTPIDATQVIGGLGDVTQVHNRLDETRVFRLDKPTGRHRAGVDGRGFPDRPAHPRILPGRAEVPTRRDDDDQPGESRWGR